MKLALVPTRKTYLLLGAGLAIATLMAAFVNIFAARVGLVIYDIALLIAFLWDGKQLQQHLVGVKRQPLGKLSIGRDNLVTLEVSSGNRNALILIADYYPQDFVASDRTLKMQLEKNTTQEVSYTVRPLKRGEYQWENIQVRQLSGWGLAWYDWSLPMPQKVAVYPDLMMLRSLSIRLTLQSSGSIRRSSRLGIGTEFAELREYGTGDDPRFIDWKATARRSKPLVRVLEPEKEQTLIILLDRGRLMTASIKGMKRFDFGLNATLALALAGLNRGDRVGIGVFDKQIHTWIPPERGSHQLSKLIERLTPIEPELLEPDYVNAVTTFLNQQTRRALVVVITDIVDAVASTELLSALARLTPRYLPFCVTLRDPEVDRQAHAFPDLGTLGSEELIKSAYLRAVALDLLAQRQVAFASLKQKGVLVLDAPADKISEELVEQYLQLKAKSLL